MSTPGDVRKVFLGALERDDVPGIVQCYRTDAVVTSPEGHFEGIEQIQAFWGAQVQQASGYQVELKGTYDTENTGIAEWVFNATNTGDLELPSGAVIPATNKPLVQRGMDLMVIVDGQISEHRLYYDQLELLDQLGLNPMGGQ